MAQKGVLVAQGPEKGNEKQLILSSEFDEVNVIFLSSCNITSKTQECRNVSFWEIERRYDFIYSRCWQRGSFEREQLEICGVLLAQKAKTDIFLSCVCAEGNESLSYVHYGKGVAAMHNATENLAFK